MALNQDEIRQEMRTLLSTKGEIDSAAILKLFNALSRLDEKHQRFTIDAKTLIHLGRDSIKDHTTALLELVKNSYDADANRVDVQILCVGNNDIIRVADNGFGMTKQELLDNWLRIGFSSKRVSKESQTGRRKTGEKGIGRISTDRLGANLELRTKTRTDGIIGLKVNWDDFDTEGKDVFDIQVELTKPMEILIPDSEGKISEAGTEIIITHLRQEWSEEQIESLYYELSSLKSPFQAVNDFDIVLDTDVTKVYSKKVDANFLSAAEIELTTIFDGSDEIFYSIKDRYKNEITETIKLDQLFSRAYPKNTAKQKEALACGPVHVKLLFFLRDEETVAKKTFSLKDLREFLNNNAGVKVYRDQIAVKPYGFPKAQLGYDWLGLGSRKAKNPAGVGRTSDYTVSPNQVVGAVFISRDGNAQLTDSAAREGLVQSDAFFDLREYVLASLRLLENHRANIYKNLGKDGNQQNSSGSKEAEKIKKGLKTVKDDLSNLKEDIEKKGDTVKVSSLIKPISSTISKVDSISADVDSSFSELIDWQRVLSGLATMGISSAVFGHETEGTIIQIKGSLKTAKDDLSDDPPDIASALEEMQKAYKSSERILAWGNYALTRVQQEKRKRKRVPINSIVKNVVQELSTAFEAASIVVEVKGQKIYSKTYPVDIESILVNLLTNAYTACISRSGVRKILINISRKDKKDLAGYEIAVSDNGPGIAKEFKERIFEPLFSTKANAVGESKSVGTGLGLTIVKSIVEELGGDISVDHDRELKGARFVIWLAKED